MEAAIYDGFIWTTEEASKITDSEFWTVDHDLKVLGRQVQDIFEYPDKYQGIEIDPPLKENAGKYSTQLMAAKWADKDNEENMLMVSKLANLTPMIDEIIIGNDRYATDCYIELPNGYTIIRVDRPEAKIKMNELELKKGDALYIYTDGITEASRSDMQMYGYERLLEVLNNNKDKSMKELDEAVRNSVSEFVGDAEQFDDMTTLCIKLL